MSEKPSLDNGDILHGEKQKLFRFDKEMAEDFDFLVAEYPHLNGKEIIRYGLKLMILANQQKINPMTYIGAQFRSLGKEKLANGEKELIDYKLLSDKALKQFELGLGKDMDDHRLNNKIKFRLFEKALSDGKIEIEGQKTITLSQFVERALPEK